MIFNTDRENFNYSGKYSQDKFEVWYFDALDNDGEYYFTARIFAGNPVVESHRKDQEEDVSLSYCGIRFFLYFRSRLIYDAVYDYRKGFFITEDLGNFSGMKIDRNVFYYDPENNKYILIINYSTSDLDNKFKAEFEFKPLINKLSFQEITAGEDKLIEYWLPLSPVNEVTGKFKFYKDFKRVKSIFTGTGYIEKTWGPISSKENLTASYWGKFTDKEYSFIFFVAEYKEGKEFRKLIIYKNNLLFLEKEDFEFELKRTFFSKKIKSVYIKSSELEIKLNNEINIESGEFGDKYLSVFEMIINGKSIISNVNGFFKNMNNS
ncbi:MAG: hypothetical protein JSS91_13325 [Bacteroidetes bacterium]|nr:hypothetical protein [Bacteroidota bacterium]